MPAHANRPARRLPAGIVFFEAGVLVLIGFCLTVSAIIPTDDEPSDELNDVLVENASGAFGMLLALWGIALGLSVYGLQYLETALAR